nr:cell growth regulator with EF hand domain protein 1 [Callithrix jacchus]
MRTQALAHTRTHTHSHAHARAQPLPPRARGGRWWSCGRPSPAGGRAGRRLALAPHSARPGRRLQLEGRRGAATWSGPGEAGGGRRGAGGAAAGSALRAGPSAPRGAAAVPGRMIPLMMRVLTLLLLPKGQAAPKDGVTRPDSEVQHQFLPNPFQPGTEQLRLLQSYLKGLERTEVKPEHLSREQVLLYLFALHDYDQSGQLDGLELLSMLTAALAPGAASSPTTNPVILIVDKVLETQDLNGDGLMTPAELINFPGEAPSHVEPREPLAPSPQEPQAVGRQSLVAKSPLRQETQEALGRREAEGQLEAKRESLESVQEPGGQAEADRDGPGPIGEAVGQAEAEDVPRPKGEAEGQAEARENGEEAKELPGETLESKNTPNEFEVHIVQLENDEI